MDDNEEFRFWRMIPHEKNQLVNDLRIADRMIEAVIAGRKRLQMLCSPGGLGKNHLLETVAKRHRIKLVFISPQTPISLYTKLWENRDTPLVCLNENERIAHNAAMINLVKLAVEDADVTHENLQLLRNEQRDDPDPTLPPTRLSGLIWLSNIDYTDETRITAAMRGHWGALIDHGLNPRLLRTGGDQGLFEYCLDLMLNRDFLRNLQLKLTDANAVLRTVVLHAEFMQTLTPRSIALLASARRELSLAGGLTAQDRDMEVGGMLSPRRLRALKLPVLTFADGRREPEPWVRIVTPSEIRGRSSAPASSKSVPQPTADAR